MRKLTLAGAIALSIGGLAEGQEIVQVPASKSGVAMPDDLFNLPPGQWYVAKQVSQGATPCTPDACEAGFNSGNLAVSVEHAKDHVRIIAGFRGCEGVAFQEIETGMRPGSYTRSRVAALLRDVVKGAEKSCKMAAPTVPKLDVASLFPRA